MTKKFFGLCLSALAISSLLFVACDETTTTENTVSAPYLTVSVASIQAKAAGGNYSFTYSVTNPADDGEISCYAESSWITNLSNDGNGTISLTVAENAGDWRTGTIAVYYSSTYGSVSQTITVVQNSSSAPELTVESTGITADIEGGIYSFDYTITNAEADATLKCRTDAEWINDFDYSVSGTVSFTVDENATTTLRQGVITIEYVSSEYSLSETVTVYQDHKGVDDSIGIDFSDIIGTYEISGYAYESSGTATYQTWTTTIYEYDNTQVLIDALTPKCVGYYPDYAGYVALATLNYYGQLVIPFQCTGYTYSSYYIGWLACTRFTEGSGWARSSTGEDITLTYDESTGIWTSDYGAMLSAFSIEGSLASFYGFIDVTNPEFTMKKISSDTSSLRRNAVSHPMGEGLTLHTDYSFEK